MSNRISVIVATALALTLFACGDTVNASAPTPCPTSDAEAVIADATSTPDAPEPCDAFTPPDAGKDAAGDATDGAAPVDCDGDRYRGVCLDTGDAKTAWGFDARCTNPYRMRNAVIQHRLNGVEFCNPEQNTEGFAVLCCAEGGDP